MKTKNLIIGLVIIVSLTFCITTCEGGYSEDDLGYRGHLPLGKYRIVSAWTSPTENPYAPENIWLQAELTEYSQAPAVGEEGALELKIGANKEVWILEAVEGYNTRVLIKHEITGKYLTMDGAWHNKADPTAADWGWQRPLVRTLKQDDTRYQWLITDKDINAGYTDTVFIESVSNTGLRLDIDTAIQHYGGGWADNSVQARTHKYGSSHWLFEKVN